MPRILRIGSSIAITVVAYWAYTLIAVPWIEPPAGARWDNRSIVAGEPVDRLAPYRQLFKPGDWELEDLISDSDGAILLDEFGVLCGLRLSLQGPFFKIGGALLLGCEEFFGFGRPSFQIAGLPAFGGKIGLGRFRPFPIRQALVCLNSVGFKIR